MYNQWNCDKFLCTVRERVVMFFGTRPLWINRHAACCEQKASRGARLQETGHGNGSAGRNDIDGLMNLLA